MVRRKKPETALLSTLLILLSVIGPILGQGGTGRETTGTGSSGKKTSPKKTPPKKTNRANAQTPSRNTKPPVEPLTAQARADRAKDYLVNPRGIDSGRIWIVDGGHHEQAAVELWIVPSGAAPPVATPMTASVAASQHINKIPSRFQHALYFPVAQQPRAEDLRRRACPTSLNVSCPSDLVQAGTPVTFTANVRGGPGTQVYNWSVTSGTITAGQGTSLITVSTWGLAGQAMTATVELGGLDPSCNRTSSCTATIAAPPPSRKFDEYGDINFEDEKARLDNFAVQLQNEPSARGYIIAYSGRRKKSE